MRNSSFENLNGLYDEVRVELLFDEPLDVLQGSGCGRGTITAGSLIVDFYLGAFNIL